MRILGAIVALCSCLVVAAFPKDTQRVIGGSVTSINQYPASAALLYSQNLNNYFQQCGGTILNTRSILTAAQCLDGDTSNRWRVRLGSSYANSGGVVHNAASLILHSGFDRSSYENDIAIIRTATSINYNDAVRPAVIAGRNWVVADNQFVWAAGWGTTSIGGPSSEQLRHVEIRSFNRASCKLRYMFSGWTITDDMFCTNFLGIDDRGQCDGDTGSAIYRNNVVVGIFSRSFICADLYYPSINTWIPSYVAWIQSNA